MTTWVERPVSPCPTQFTNTRGLARWTVVGLSIVTIVEGLNTGFSAVQRAWYAGETQPVDESFDTVRGLSFGLAMLASDCDSGGSYVSGLAIHGEDPFQDYPGRTALLEQLGECADGPVAQHLTPEPEGWELGDRVSICFRSTTPTA